MVQLSAFWAIFVAANIGPAFSLPGRSTTTVCPASSTPASSTPASSTPASSTRASSTPASSSSSVATPFMPTLSSAATASHSGNTPIQTIYIAALGEGESKSEGKSKWLTYMVANGEPDWCDGANSIHTIPTENTNELGKPRTFSNHDEPGNILYGTHFGDASYMNGCSYDSENESFGCVGWSASCFIMTDGDRNGKHVDTCDNMEVLSLIKCTRYPSSSHSSQTIGPSASATPTYTSLCEDKNQNAVAWKNNHMNDFVYNLAHDIPSGYDKSFLDFVKSKATGVNKFECDFTMDGSTTCIIDREDCKKGNNPRLYWVQDAIANFHGWINVILDAIQNAKVQFGEDSFGITSDFIRTKLPSDDQTWLATVLGGILGTAGGLFGAASFAVPELAIPAGFAGGASGLAAFGGGIASSAMENADGIIQNELNELSAVQDYITQQLNMTQKIIYEWADQAVNGKGINPNPANHDGYFQQDVNLANLLMTNAFANDTIKTGISKKSEKSLQVNESMLKYMWGAAIGYLWSSQNLMVVKLSKSLGKHGAPCDLDLLPYTVRKCDGETAWFFLKAKEAGAVTDPPVEGADDKTLSKYGLSLLDMAQGANWTQSAFGFGANFGNSTNSTIHHHYTSLGTTPKYPFVSIPFCDLDAIEDKWHPHMDRIEKEPAKFVIDFLSHKICSQYSVTIDGDKQSWPFSTKAFPTKDQWSEWGFKQDG